MTVEAEAERENIPHSYVDFVLGTADAVVVVDDDIDYTVDLGVFAADVVVAGGDSIANVDVVDVVVVDAAAAAVEGNGFVAAVATNSVAESSKPAIPAGTYLLPLFVLLQFFVPFGYVGLLPFEVSLFVFVLVLIPFHVAYVLVHIVSQSVLVL